MGEEQENRQITGVIQAVCVSESKGVGKTPVSEAVFTPEHGIEGDAHAGTWHRQISLLSGDKVDEFNQSGAGVKDGDFGENLVVRGIDFRSLPVGSILTVSSPVKGGGDNIAELCGGRRKEPGREVIMEMTQIGKACHNGCAIKQRMGVCIMPVEGVFARVIKGGTVRPGDVMTVTQPDPDRPFTAAVITVSDRSAAGIREDLSGPAAADMLTQAGYQVLETIIVPDEQDRISWELKRLADQRQISLVVTSGGTGFSLRDRTPEATLEVADRVAPGIAEAIRAKSLAITDRAMLSRGVSVIRNQTLIVNLPGSPKAVKESLGFILGALEHGLGILRGTADN